MLAPVKKVVAVFYLVTLRSLWKYYGFIYISTFKRIGAELVASSMVSTKRGAIVIKPTITRYANTGCDWCVTLNSERTRRLRINDQATLK